MDKTLTGLLSTRSYETNKPPLYFANYEEFLRPLRDKEIKLLELGVHNGGSLLLWRDYFEKGTIAGVDIKPLSIFKAMMLRVYDPARRIHIYQGAQEDCALLDRIGKEVAPDGFDVVIDDASHIGELTRVSFWHLLQHHLKPGGIYVIEDWGTGYWDSWPDGKRYEFTPDSKPMQNPMTETQRPVAKRQYPNHSYGMVGFIKELVDECGMGDITMPNYGLSPYREPRIQKIQISHGQVFVVKR